jgi:hypothetical protein
VLSRRRPTVLRVSNDSLHVLLSNPVPQRVRYHTAAKHGRRCELLDGGKAQPNGNAEGENRGGR